jgi:hypothetical protein
VSSGVIPNRIEGEATKAYRAFVDYCQMGPGRTIRGLYQQCIEDASRHHRLRTLLGWSSKHSWQDRVSDYDKAVAEQREQARQQKQLEIIDGALVDFDDMLDVWRRRWGMYKASGTGVTAMSLREMERMRRELDDFARRSVGLPDRVTESTSTLKGTGKDGAIKIDDARAEYHARSLATLADALGGLLADGRPAKPGAMDATEQATVESGAESSG